MKSKLSKQIKLKKIKDDPNIKIKKTKLGSSDNRILKFESSPSQSILERLSSPKYPKLKPIQTTAKLPKPSKSSSQSPNKYLHLKSPILSPSSSSIKLEIPIRKKNSRRTQSMNSDLIQTIIPISANFINRCMFKSRVGTVYGKNKKENQDSFIIYSNLLGSQSNYLFSVCDGHGNNGHKVSRYLKHSFPSIFEKHLSKGQLSENSIKSSYRSAIKECESQLINSDVDVQFSGSTMVSVIVISNFLICANIGDSRAVIGKKEEIWVAEDLSRDHKPELEDEALRIENSNGRIQSIIGHGGVQMGPKRVWLQDREFPGLAMSRSICDLIASSVGVISDPEFTTRPINKSDAFLIIASDGLWEFTSSQEAVQQVGHMLDTNKSQFICDELVSQSVRKWNRLQGTIDDITVLVIFLNNN